MTYWYRYLLIICMVALCTSGCRKERVRGPVLPQHVEWNIDNGTDQIAETISFIRLAGNNYIYAAKGNTEIFVATSSTLTGSYSLSNANGSMGLSISGAQYTNLSCNITISSNSNSMLKGTFSGTLGLVNVDTVNITGIFEDIPY